MAKKDKYSDYKKILDSYSKAQSTTSDSKSTTNSYKARLEAGGVDVNKATDDRNIIEKALNLKQDQNILFDLFELLNRPQQAVFNAWKAGQEGGDTLGAAWKGLSGQNEVKFKEILKNYGMEEDPNKFDLTDVAGFAGDVLLDPMNLIPVAGFGKFNDALEAGESLTKAAKNLKTGSDVVMGGIAKGLKGTAKLADKGIEKALAKSDEVAGVLDSAGNVVKFKYTNPNANRAADLVKVALGTGENVTEDVIGRLENYKQLKNDISRLFTVSKNHLRAILAQRNQDTLQESARLKNISLTEQAEKAANEYAKAHNIDPEEFAKDIALFHGATMPREFLDIDIWNSAKEGGLDANDDVLEALNRIIKRDIPEDVLAKDGERILPKVNEQGKIVLGEDILNGKYDIKPLSKERVVDTFEQLQKAISNKDMTSAGELASILRDNITVVNPSYTPEQLDKIRNMVNTYSNDDSFRNLMDYIMGTSWKIEPLEFTDNIFNDIPNYINDKNKLMANNMLDYTSPLQELNDILRPARRAGENVASKGVKPGLIDRLNQNIDDIMGSGLAEKYDPLSNVGYMPNTLTDEAAKINDEFNVMFNGKTPSKGNVNLLKPRKKFGSAAEINNEWRDIINSLDNETLPAKVLAFKKSNADFMEENYFKAIKNRYLTNNGITKVVKDANMANQVLLGQTFGDIEAIKKLHNDLENATVIGDVNEIKDLTKKLNDLEEASGIKLLTKDNKIVPKGFKQIKKNDFIARLKKYNLMNKQVGIDSGMNGLIKSLETFKGQVAIDENILNMFDIISNRDNYTGLSGLYGKYMNMFKKWKTVSPTYILNNLLGNSSNLMLGGVSYADQAKYGATVVDILTNGEKNYLARLSGQKLSANANRIADLWDTYRKMGFDQSALKLQELPDEFRELFKQGRKLKGREWLNALPYVNNLANIQMDNAARLTIMLKAMDDPGFIKRLGVDNIRDAIARIMFDPEMLTSFEQNTVKKFIPFYTYAKNNLIYHITNMGQNGKKYSQLMKSMKGLQDLATNDNSENMSDFLKEGLYIPIPGLDENGNYKMLRASLPYGQMLEFASNPLSELTSMLTPAAKLPLELVMNKDTFTGRDIESFPGELSKDFPNLTKKQVKLLGDLTGLDVPLKNVGRVATGIGEGLGSDQNILSSIGRGLGNTVTMTNSVDDDALYRSYEEVDELQNLMKKYKQRGYTFATINELRQANKNKTVEGIDAIFNKYGISTNRNTKKSKYDELRDLLNK